MRSSVASIACLLSSGAEAYALSSTGSLGARTVRQPAIEMKLGAAKALPVIVTPEPEPDGVFGILSSALDTVGGVANDAAALASGLGIDADIVVPVVGLGAAAAAAFVVLQSSSGDSRAVASTMGIAFEADEWTPAMKDALALKQKKMSLSYKLSPVFDKVDEIKEDIAAQAQAKKLKAEAAKAAKAKEAERDLALKEGRLVELQSELPVVGPILSGVVVPNPFAAVAAPELPSLPQVEVPNPFASAEK